MKKWISISIWFAVFFAAGWYSIKRLPPQHNPFTPLSISHPIGFGTSTKISRFAAEPDTCFGFLDNSDIEYTRLVDAEPEQSCGFYNALTLNRSELPYSITLRMTCPLTSALMVWEKQSVIRKASDFFEAPPAKILSYGSYACRRKYGRSSGSYSEHATANAVDIKGVVLADGTQISVLEHWGKDTEKGRFLKTIRDDACDVFGTVLGPEYNDAHADHFHFDMSASGICR